MAVGWPFLCSTKFYLYFTLNLLILSFSKLPWVLNTKTSSLNLYHSQRTRFRGKDCVYGVNTISSSKRSVMCVLSHVSCLSVRLSYYCNLVVTFQPTIKLIYDNELNPGPVQVSDNNKKPSSNSRATSLNIAHMHNQQSLLRKPIQHKPWMIHFNCTHRWATPYIHWKPYFGDRSFWNMAQQHCWRLWGSYLRLSSNSLRSPHGRKGGGVAIYLLNQNGFKFSWRCDLDRT